MLHRVGQLEESMDPRENATRFVLGSLKSPGHFQAFATRYTLGTSSALSVVYRLCI